MRKGAQQGANPLISHMAQLSRPRRALASSVPFWFLSPMYYWIYTTCLFFSLYFFHYVMMMNMNIKARQPRRQYEPSHTAAAAALRRPIMLAKQLVFSITSLWKTWPFWPLCIRRQISFRLTVRNTGIILALFLLNISTLVFGRNAHNNSPTCFLSLNSFVFSNRTWNNWRLLAQHRQLRSRRNQLRTWPFVVIWKHVFFSFSQRHSYHFSLQNKDPLSS
jgi:hypothetical protein